MLGQLIWDKDARFNQPLQVVERMGLLLLQGRVNPEGRFARWRLRWRLRQMGRQGVRRLLVPEGFSQWQLASGCGMMGVDELPFLRRNCGQILILALKKSGLDPSRCCVALRGMRVGNDMAQTADYLVPRVRDISIFAPVGGERLQRHLRNHWGLAVRPDGRGVAGAICFDDRGAPCERVNLKVYGSDIELGGLAVDGEKVHPFDGCEPLPFLAALWEAGKLAVDDLEFYLT